MANINELLGYEDRHSLRGSKYPIALNCKNAKTKKRIQRKTNKSKQTNNNNTEYQKENKDKKNITEITRNNGPGLQLFHGKTITINAINRIQAIFLPNGEGDRICEIAAMPKTLYRVPCRYLNWRRLV